MSRSLQNEPVDALERILDESKHDEARLRTLLHELSFRSGPQATVLRGRAEQARLQLVIAKASAPKPAQTTAPEPDAPVPTPPRDDFPGFNPGPILDGLAPDLAPRSEMVWRQAPAAPPAAQTAPVDTWRRPETHLALLAVTILGGIALTAAVLNGAFRPETTASLRSNPIDTAIEVPQMRAVPLGATSEDGNLAIQSDTGQADAAGPSGAKSIQASLANPSLANPSLANASMTGALPPAMKPRVNRLNVTTEIANMYSGEGPAIARAAVAAAGLGVNETVRWRNEKTRRHGAVTLLAQNPDQANCYTARITRLDTRPQQQRTRQLCF